MLIAELKVYSITPSGRKDHVLIKARQGDSGHNGIPPVVPTTDYAEHHFVIPVADARKYAFGASIHVLMALSTSGSASIHGGSGCFVRS